MPENTIVIIDLIKLLLISLAVERITEILVASKLFAPVRDKLRDINLLSTPSYNVWWFLDGIFHCGYCMSVWVSIPFAFYNEFAISSNIIINFISSVFVIHGLSNSIHVLYEFIRRGRVKYHDISVNYKRIKDE